MWVMLMKDDYLILREEIGIQILKQRYAKNRLNKIVLTRLQLLGQIFSARDRRDGQAAGRYVLRRKGSVISP
jgi:hypothetical protein